MTSSGGLDLGHSLFDYPCPSHGSWHSVLLSIYIATLFHHRTNRRIALRAWEIISSRLIHFGLFGIALQTPAGVCVAHDPM